MLQERKKLIETRNYYSKKWMGRNIQSERRRQSKGELGEAVISVPALHSLRCGGCGFEFAAKKNDNNNNNQTV